MPPMIDMTGNKIYHEDGLTVIFQYMLFNFNFHSKNKLTSHFINMCFQLRKKKRYGPEIADGIFILD